MKINSFESSQLRSHFYKSEEDQKIVKNQYISQKSYTFPVASLKMTSKLSTREIVGPFRSSFIRVFMASHLPSAITKTLPSLRFIGLQFTKSLSAAFFANLRKPTPCTLPDI